MGSRSTSAGTEVPIIGSDSLKWIEVSVPSSSTTTVGATATDSSPPIGPPSQNCASSVVIGDPPTYLIWRIHEALPNALELIDLTVHGEFSRTGLRINFPFALSPFAFICKNEIAPTHKYPYLLYAFTVTGVAFLLKIKKVNAYVSCSIIPSDELLELDLQAYPNNGPVTCVAAVAGCLVVGIHDGSVGCFKLGTLDQNEPGFFRELRDESGISRLLGFMSRGRLACPVQDMVISEVHEKQLLFVLHADGNIRVWDLLSCIRIFSHTMTVPTPPEVIFIRIWVGQADLGSSLIPFAILSRKMEVGLDTVSVYCIRFSSGDKISLLLDPSVQYVSLDEACLDVKFSSEKIWILKDNGLVSQSWLDKNTQMEEAQWYALQEEFVADQLFQSPEYSSDALPRITHTIFSSMKDHAVPFISSIFLRRLLQPGVLHESVLRTTLRDYNKLWTDFEFQSLTADGLKKEILSLIELEGGAVNTVSIFNSWRNFCTRYFHHWCGVNAPLGLYVEVFTDAVCLIRKNSISVFRCLEDIEQLVDGFSDEGEILSFGSGSLGDDQLDILLEVVKCISSVSQQLGKTASAIFQELLLNKSVIGFEEIVAKILKILENGYNSSLVSLEISDLGTDQAWERGLKEHKDLRKFSVDMLLSLHSLYKKAASWDRVLDVVEKLMEFLVPPKIIQKLDSQVLSDINTSVLVQSTSQIAKAMFGSSLDVLLFLSYLINNSGQIHLDHVDKSRVQLQLVPMIEETISEWHIIHFIATTPSEPAAVEDFSSQLSLLQIDTKAGKESSNEKLGKCDFTVAFVLLLNYNISAGEPGHLSSTYLPTPYGILTTVRTFTSLIIWGKTGECSSFLNNSIQLAVILFRHGQYDAVEYLLRVVEEHSHNEKTSHGIQDIDGGCCLLNHLLGCCLLAQANFKLHGVMKERKVHEAVCCLFRASSGKGSSQALQSLPCEAGLIYIGSTGCVSGAAWRFHYYSWAMQTFEQYNFSEGACQFALAALEEVDEALSTHPSNESATTIKGRLWANVFKFTLDLDHFYEAYCAILSNPDEESKYICLRRFIIVLYEHGAIKILCNGQLPFIGLTEKVEQELALKADRSDIMSKPNLYKLLYAFEMHRHNWRRAASYMYLYSARLRTEVEVLKDDQRNAWVMQERLSGLSAAINALHLVQPAYAWIDPLVERNFPQGKHYPSKKVKRTVYEQSSNDVQPEEWQFYIDIKKLEDEFLLTLAEYHLSITNVKWKSTEIHKAPSELVDLLVQNNLYDISFTVLLRFWEGSKLKRELERVFSDMSMKCCPNRVGLSWIRNDVRANSLLLTSSESVAVDCVSPDMVPRSEQSKENIQWESLEHYLEKYKSFHGRLPAVVAETLLRADPQIELPLWLVHMFKDGQSQRTWGMTGQELNPASLFQIYVDYGRYQEAANLLLEYIESYASVPAKDLIRRKKPFAAWFPYTSIERLWCQLEELISSGHMVDQCEKLKKLLHGALLSHLNLLKTDSEDAASAYS